MSRGCGLLCAVALLSIVGVVVCARGSGGVNSGWMPNHVDVVPGLRKMLQDNVPDKALLGAVVVGKPAIVQRVLDAGANPNALDDRGMITPLIMASQDGKINVVRTLLNAGADVNFGNSAGMTALHYAALKGNSNIVVLLLDNGADLNSENNWGRRPLVSASRNGHPEALRKLIDAGGDVSHQDNRGWTPLHHAARHARFSVVKLLLEKGANTEIETFHNKQTPINLAVFGGSGLIIQTLIDAGADKDHRRSGSSTPLIDAAYWGKIEAIEVLVLKGADKCVVTQGGLTAKENVCLCATQSAVDPLCDVKSCEDAERMKRLL